ncbi:LytTR family DNA-binding domain-containing protein [Demequina sp. NBRC 110052]|uniref:LytR/AlgR family response regulator transcription factor n=1 Tax=Demequina sp. NBRC 110052 TaxID=1570341 RepID=UPI0009FF5E47|nr:LytTR family DNA-binding domain-containing protein [Demequina sp. NBRC 110052]
MIRIGIVEDDEYARDALLAHLRRYQEENSVVFDVRTFADGAELVDTFASDFDILFLDIEMPQVGGLEAARHVRQVDTDVIIVFVTNMAQYAIKGYEVDALSYLLKPVPYFSLSQELTRSLSRLNARDEASIVLNVGGSMTRVDLPDIVYIESIRHRIIVHTRDQGELTFTGTLKAFEAELDGKGFYRSNNCYLVNLQHVRAVQQSSCTMLGGDELQVSRPRKKGFLEALTDYVGGKPS